MNFNRSNQNQLLIAFILSVLAILTEFRSIKETTLFTQWFDAAPFLGLCGAVVIFLVVAIWRFFSKRAIFTFLLFLVCGTSLLFILWHQKKVNGLDKSPTAFTAITQDIGNDGGFRLDFKKNGHLKAEKGDHWSFTEYWGNYTRHGDTIKLDIDFDFKLGKEAIMVNDSLHFIGSTFKFYTVRFE
jgi:hypothetical protein